MTTLQELLLTTVPPHDEDAERAVLKLCLENPNLIPEVQRDLQRGNFHVLKHALMFASMIEQYRHEGAVDPILLAAYLGQGGHFGDFGGEIECKNFIDGVASDLLPVDEHLHEYIEIIKGKARDRKIIEIGAPLIRNLLEPGDHAEELQTAISGMTAAVRESAPSEVFETREPFTPFPVDLLPKPFSTLARAGAAAMGCDASFIALPSIVLAGGAIGNSARAFMKGGWTEPPIFWGAVVGKSGTLKSPALELALMPLRKRQDAAFREHADAMKTYDRAMIEYEATLSQWKRDREGPPPEKPAEPAAVRFLVDDTTVEALTSIHANNPRGLTVAKDELAGWLSGFDRYVKSGRGGGDVARYLEMHAGRSITSDRKGAGQKTIHVPRAAVSIIGGIQPATLARMLTPEFSECGLTARLLLACPPARPKTWTDAELDPALLAEVEAVFDRLLALEMSDEGDGPRPRLIRLSADAKALWVTFYNERALEQQGLDDDLAAAWSKLEAYCVRLALVHHLVRAVQGQVDEELIDAESMAAGIGLARWFGAEARRVYGLIDETAAERERRELVELVERLDGKVTPSKLMQRTRKYRTAADAEAALEDLIAAGLGRWEVSVPGPHGGRPASMFVLKTVYETPRNANGTP